MKIRRTRPILFFEQTTEWDSLDIERNARATAPVVWSQVDSVLFSISLASLAPLATLASLDNTNNTNNKL